MKYELNGNSSTGLFELPTIPGRNKLFVMMGEQRALVFAVVVKPLAVLTRLLNQNTQFAISI